MGSILCPGQRVGDQVSYTSSGIYLSNPANLARTQIRRSAQNNISDSTSSYVGSDTSVILGCKPNQNRELLNKYMITYLYFLKNKSADPGLEIKDFVRLLRILDDNKQFEAEIQKFEEEYTKKLNPKDKAEYLIGEYFKNGFLSSAIEKFPIYSSDPSIIGYARRPIVDLNKGIKSKYDKQSKMKEIFCVIQLPESEEKLLRKMAENSDYFTFSTFVRCFSSQDKATARLKQLNKMAKQLKETLKIPAATVMLNIQIPKEQVDQDYDYGFYQDPAQKQNPLGDIIMNILNFFQVTGAEPQNKTYDLKYNGLARLIHLRGRELSHEPELLKVTKLIQGQCQQIKTHSNLLRLVANTRLSITASQTLKKSSGLKDQSQDNERINLIEAYLEQKNYDMALEQCKEKNTNQFKVRKAQICYEAGRQNEAEEILKQVEPYKKQLKKQHFKEYVLFEYICAKIKRKRGETQKAKEHLETLSEAMKQEYRSYYEYRGREVQGQLVEIKGKNQNIDKTQKAVDPVKWQSYAEGLNIGVLLSR